MSRTKRSSKLMQRVVSICCMAAIAMLLVVEPRAATNDEASVLGAGAPVYFTKAYVDSNTYSYITSNTMTQSKSYAEVKISAIYDASGSSSDYQYVWVKATSNGEAKKVKVGDNWTKISIPSANQFAGMNIAMYAMGNNPKLDCMISGAWLVY